MIKKIAAKLKKILGRKPKETKVTHVETAKAEKISPRQTKTHPVEKPEIKSAPRKPYKKETREEYRLRHEKGSRKLKQ